MKKLTCYNYEFEILLDKGYYYNIIIKNKSEYYAFVTNLKKEIYDGEELGFNLSDNDEKLDIKKNCLLIMSLFDFFSIDRKTMNSFYKHVISTLSSTDIRIKLSQFESQYNQMMKFIQDYIDLDVDYDDEIDLLALLKFANIKPSLDADEFIEFLIKYIILLSNLCGYSIVILLNLHDFLSLDELNLFLHEMNIYHINIINISNRKDGVNLSNQIEIIIDEDLCEFSSQTSIDKL